MRSLILNKNISVSAIFFFLLCFKGGDMAAWVTDKTNLITWLEANKLNNTFSGADFSVLPAIAVIAGMYAVSHLIIFVTEIAFAAYAAFSSVPETTELVVSKNPQTAAQAPEHKEQEASPAQSERHDTPEKH
ncbi:hypothetical protein GL420_17960 [Salmonella enterica]|nr:hypothetical protein [Salmonella enterica subsp. enterica serovar Enteritidis]EEL9185497.1 hypothetical protein [Salmonella enterica]EIJ8452176.1 hypothetical protein [Salmonella enterica]